MKRNLSKKSYGFMLLCSLLLMVSISSCQQSKLKAVIAIANKECPIDMGDVGTVTSIVYDGNNVVYTLNMNESMTDIAVLKDNPENLKESTKIMFRNPAKDVKEMLKLIAECNAGLQMKFVGKDSGQEVVSGLSSEEVKEILNAEADPAQSERAKLEAQIKMTNLQFPMQASEEVIIEKMELSDESVVYICKVDEDICPVSQIEANAEGVKEGIVANLSAQTDPATQAFLQSCINNDKNIVYRYIGTKSDNQYDVVVTLSELKNMIIKE
ncbi:hypothetical protein [uncultured Bacteroides sp.]|uniref:hypothetical protein n=1 Tax=uncultured Bacteroides sp. TaxID=162156 RepID=UPI0025E6C53D|nr:hypothetical protein [uncultured Bacteroides sp.]